MQTFHALLMAEGIGFQVLAANHPLAKNTVTLASADDFRRLVCKLPKALRTVTAE